MMNVVLSGKLTLAAAVAAVMMMARADSAVLYVDASCANPVAPYDTPATASTNIALAVAHARANDGAFEIRVKTGTYVETGFVLDKSIQVVGDTGNPADVTVSAESETTRAFTLSDDGAAVKNLTISGRGHRVNSSSRFDGGHVNMSAGLVENCVITGSRPAGTTYGANVYVTGGRLLRCQVLDASYNVDSGYYRSYGMGIYATGGIVESCLLKGNVANGASVFGAAARLEGTVTMINCTVVGNSSPRAGDSYIAGVDVASSKAKVVNTVLYNNGGTAAKEFGSNNLGCFSHCASTVTNASCVAWTVITAEDFEKVEDDDYRPAINGQLLDAGTRDTTWVPASMSEYDLIGMARVSGREIDIGCYETDQSSLTVTGTLSTYGTLEGGAVTAKATAVGGSGTYVFKWNFGNGTERTTEQSEYLFSYPASGLYTVRLAASDNGGATWSDWFELPAKIVIAPEKLFVDATCTNPVYPYRTAATAATRIRDAIGALTNNVSGEASCVSGVTVRVASGTYVESGIALGSAVTVLGATGNPADVTVSAESATTRAFTLSDKGAVVKNLTISGRGYRVDSTAQFNGGHVNMSAGLVENCVITGARPVGKTYGGNVYMSGGRLSRCQVLDASYNVNSGYYSSYGMGVYASGGIIESCFLKGNAAKGASVFDAAARLEGSVTMINCTLVENSVDRDARVAGVNVASSNAKVVNTVLYDNGGTGVKEFGSGNLGCYDYCASSVTNALCASWRVIDASAFKNYDRVSEDLVNLYPSGSPGEALVRTGCPAREYAEKFGAVSQLDLLGRKRIVGKRLDIGCVAGKPTGLAVFVR